MCAKKDYLGMLIDIKDTTIERWHNTLALRRKKSIVPTAIIPFYSNKNKSSDNSSTLLTKQVLTGDLNRERNIERKELFTKEEGKITDGDYAFGHALRLATLRMGKAMRRVKG